MIVNPPCIESLEERMRQFTVVVKYAMQTGQMSKRSFLHSRRSLMRIAIDDFQLSSKEYMTCYMRAKTFVHRIKNSPTSDDVLAGK